MAEREIVLLSGMHRSGTSALARVFNLLGAVLPEPLVAPALGNELGHWEPAEAVAMNDAALLAAGSDVNSLHPLSPEWVDGDGGEAFVEEVRAWLERVAPPRALTVVKDPRIALLAPFWRRAVERLGAQPRFVLSWRDPWEVARSLASRQLAHFPDEAWPHERVELLWLRHQLELERASRGAPRSFVAYADVLDDWRATVTRVFEDLRLAPPRLDPGTAVEIDAFLRPEARRQRRAGEAAVEGDAATVSALLKAGAGDPGGGADGFDRAAARLHDAVRLLGGYLGALEARIAADAATSETGDGRTLVAALGEAARAAELRAAERVRSLPAEAPDVEAFAALRSRHEGLRAAHAQVVDELRESRSASQARLDSAREAHGRDLAAHGERLAELQRAQASRTAALQRDLLGQTDRADSAEGAQGRAEAALERLRAEAARLAAEIDDHRAAYEALRHEAVAGRGDLAAARREQADAGERLAASAATAGRLETERDALAAERDAGAAAAQALRRELVALRAEAADLRAEAAALRASASWRLTRPVRSVTFRLRRLARR